MVFSFLNEDMLSCLNVNLMATSPVRLAQALFFALSIIDGLELNHGFNLFSTLHFLKGTRLSILVTKELVKLYITVSDVG